MRLKSAQFQADHPRVGGEHVGSCKLCGVMIGSSPRGRGTPPGTEDLRRQVRIIPAWAGNTAVVMSRIEELADHPRVGGEHGPHRVPRACQAGSSPRGRGTLHAAVDTELQRRIIPAWAGNTISSITTAPKRTDHPRVGGEHQKPRLYHLTSPGSSPRGRGTHGQPLEQQENDRIIPAWAGNTARHAVKRSGLADHPRVGGEHFWGLGVPCDLSGSSPRGRGTRPRSRRLHRWPRIIPAWAGNTYRFSLSPSLSPDHPRVGGEHIKTRSPTRIGAGSSPRGRGTPA